MIAKAVSNQSRFFHYKVSFVHASKDNLMLSTSNQTSIASIIIDQYGCTLTKYCL